MMIRLESLLPVVLPGLAFLLWYLRTRHRFTADRLVMTGSFALYLLLVSKYTIFPLWFGAEYTEAAHSRAESLAGVNLVPFKSWSLEYLRGVQCWGNIALGVPFGFLYPFVMPATAWPQLARSGVLFPIVIELTQLALSFSGFTSRIIDINDVLLNFTGVMLGYMLLRAVALVYRSALTHWPRQASRREMLGHIQSVLLRHSYSEKA
jgi:glycopeptide antibiotics resistance protein